MKLNLKQGEHIRIKHDSGQPFMVYIERGVIHISATPGITRTQLIIKDKSVDIERVKSAD